MRRPSFRLLPYAFVLALLVTPSMAAASELPNPYCPVLPDEKSDPNLMIEYKGQKVYFCCSKCVRKFQADPEKYLANLPQFKKTEPAPEPKGADAPKATGGKQEAREKEHEEKKEEEEGGPKSLTEFAGRLHLVAVHFPIALVVVAAFFELIGLVAFREALAGATRALLWAGALCAIVTVVTGWIQASFESYNAELGRILTLHRWGGTTLAVLVVLALVFREKAERGANARLKWAYRAVLLAAAALTLLVGHWGGELVHGSEFLELPL